MKKQNMAPESATLADAASSDAVGSGSDAAEWLEAENRRIAALDPAAREAEFSDPYNIPPDFWDNGTLTLGPNKVEIHIRLDTEVVDWFKGRGRGYQSRINAVLRSYVKAQVRAEKEKVASSVMSPPATTS